MLCGDNSNNSKQIGKTSKDKRCPCCCKSWSNHDISFKDSIKHFELRDIFYLWKNGSEEDYKLLQNYGFLHLTPLFEGVDDWDNSVFKDYILGLDSLHISIGHLKHLFKCFQNEKEFDKTTCHGNIYNKVHKVIGNKSMFSSADWRTIFLYGVETILPSVKTNQEQAFQIITTMTCDWP